MKKILLDVLSKSGQRGVALLFALAILALLLVMALSFATSSIFDQITASNAANSGSARLVANSALNRILTILSAYGDSPVSNIQYSYNTSGPNHQDMIKKLFAGSGTNFTTQQVSWEYIKQQDSISDRIVGRFAYIVTPISGIDPGAIVKKGVDEALVSEPRIGVDVDEINVTSVNPTDITAHAGKFNYTAAAALPVVQPNPGFYDGTWIDYANMFGLMTITDAALQAKFKKWFILDSSPSDEKYWVDVNANNTQDANEFFHRFNLSRADWSTAFNTKEKVYENILLDSNADGVPEAASTAYTNSGAEDGKGIPWLAFLGMKDSGVSVEIPPSSGLFYNRWIDDDVNYKATFDTALARRRQIAANLVDYCRVITDPPTSDVANWTAADPAYTGNKRTPYINEIGISVQANISRSLFGTATFRVDVDFFAELINIYPDLADSAATVTIIYDYSFNTYVDGVGVASQSLSNQTKTFIIASTNWLPGLKYSNKTAELLFSWTGTKGGLGMFTNHTAKIDNFNLKIKKVVLACDVTGDGVTDGNYDCAKINTASSYWTPVNTVTTTALSTDDGYFNMSFQTDDPRQNLNKDDWCLAESTAVSGSGTAGAPFIAPTSAPADIRTFAAKNKFNGTLVDPSTGTNRDSEVVTDPAKNGTAGLSTAYIRHAPMLSPWELGFIHRGEKWQTINLKKYDATKAVKAVAASAGAANVYLPGGGLYTDGDANILNQIKMSSATQKYKENINAKYVDLSSGKNVVLQALLDKIIIGSNPATPGTLGSGNKITIGSSLDNLCVSIMANNYVTRAEVVNAGINVLSNGACGFTQDTDAKQEELIGKFINLTDISGSGVRDYFTVIILAQTVKDVGAPSSAAIGIPITKKDRNGNAAPAFSAKLGTPDIQEFPVGSGNYVYADEIVAEQKIRVIVHREAVGTYRILSFEYIE